jgi:hypothetical protein
MGNTGKELEKLVREMEERFLGAGFTVTPRVLVYDADGAQVAEFDILITGTLGDTPIEWLIECRDRPSDGPAPMSWIEQLVGRKLRFNFDKVIAVSTTGFARGVVREARRLGITLRTVNAIGEIGDDFAFHTINLGTVAVGYTGEVQLSSPDLSQDEGLETDADLQVKRIEDTDYRPLGKYILDQIAEQVYASLLGPDVKIGAVLHKDTFVCTTPLDCLVGQERRQLVLVLVPVELWIERTVATVFTMRLYAEDNRVIGQEAHYVLPSGADSLGIRVQQINTAAGTVDWRLIVPEPREAELLARLPQEQRARVRAVTTIYHAQLGLLLDTGDTVGMAIDHAIVPGHEASSNNGRD